MAGFMASHLVRGIWPLVQLMRPKQWVKNGFVLAPLLFSGQFLNYSVFLQTLGATLLFCLASSAIYVVNDLADLERDRQHPKKSLTRPLAAGRLSPFSARVFLLILGGLLVWGGALLPRVGLVIAGYILLNLAYTFYLKHQPVVDIFCIAVSFVLRVYAGAVAVHVLVSAWMFVTTLSLALYLAAIKRRQEITQSGVEGRKVLEKYSVALINRYAEMAATGALVFYSLFVLSAKPQLIITIPLVLFGLYRYWFIVESLDGGESPTDVLLFDWQLLATVLVWIALCFWALWPSGGI